MIKCSMLEQFLSLKCYFYTYLNSMIWYCSGPVACYGLAVEADLGLSDMEGEGRHGVELTVHVGVERAELDTTGRLDRSTSALPGPGQSFLSSQEQVPWSQVDLLLLCEPLGH